MEEIYRSKKSKMIGLLVLFILFIALGVFALFTKDTGGIIAGVILILLFGAGAVFMLGNIFLGSYLKLTEQGFEFYGSFRKNFVNWSDVKNFYVTRIPTPRGSSSKFVTYNYSDKYSKQELARNIAKSISGGEAMLPDNYGKKPEELADIMNSWKKKFNRCC